MNADEALWVEALKNGDPSHFAPLYQQLFPRIYQICFRFTGHAGEAEEHAQDIFMRLLDQVQSFRGDSSFFTWFYRLAVNHLKNVIRKSRIQEVQQEYGHDVAGHPPAHMTRLFLEQAIAELPDGFRTVFILHDREGLTHREIAEILDIQVSTSKSQLCRARFALREQLQPHLRSVES